MNHFFQEFTKYQRIEEPMKLVEYVDGHVEVAKLEPVLRYLSTPCRFAFIFKLTTGQEAYLVTNQYGWANRFQSQVGKWFKINVTILNVSKGAKYFIMADEMLFAEDNEK